MAPKAGPLIRPAADDGDPEVAARASDLLDAYRAAEEGRAATLNDAIDLLAVQRDKALIDGLVALLGHEDAHIRRLAEYGLRRVVGRDFGYNADAAEQQRRAAAGRAGAWWRTARDGFDFAAPGRLQVAGILGWPAGSSRQVMLIGLNGGVIWSRPLPGWPQCVAALPNGHLLISSYGSDRAALEEYDPDGKVVWSAAKELGLTGVLKGAERLPNGNTLALDLTNQRVVEIDSSGRKIVWQHAWGDLSITVAKRLSNGHTAMFGFQGKFLEVAPDGKVVRTMDGPHGARDVQVLANGNVLVADLVKLRVVELGPEAQEVWSWACPSNTRPITAQRLPDGRTVVQLMSVGLVLVDAAGRDSRRLTPEAMRGWSCYPCMALAPAGAERLAEGNWAIPAPR